MPRATELAPIVRATFDTSAVPSIENEPVTSPVANVTVLEAIHLPAAPAVVAVVADPALPALTAVPAEPAVTEVPAEPAVVDVVALPEKVVAVIVLPRADIPESTKTAVPANPVEDLEPSKYNVAVVSVVVVITCADVAVPLKKP